MKTIHLQVYFGKSQRIVTGCTVRACAVGGGSIDLSVLCAVSGYVCAKVTIEIFIHLAVGFFVWCVFLLSVYLEMLGDLRLFQTKQKTNTR